MRERGIRSYDKRTRNVFVNVSAIPVLRELTHLPIIADPSHATGYTRLVAPVAYAAAAAGADGLEVEVHHIPLMRPPTVPRRFCLSSSTR